MAITLLPIAPGGAQTVVSVAEAQANVTGFAALSADVQLALVVAADGALNAATGRQLALRRHLELHQPDMTRRLSLAHKPVWKVARVAAGWGAVLTVQNAGAGVSRASIELATTGQGDEVQATGLRLTRVAGGVAVAENGGSPLGFATYPTVGALAAAIAGVGNGWTATVQGSSDSPSNWATADIHPEVGARGCYGNPAQLFAFQRDLRLYESNPKQGVVYLHENLTPARVYPEQTWAASGYYASVCVDYQAGFNADPALGAVTMPGSLKAAAFALITSVQQRIAAGDLVSEKTSLQEYKLAAQGFTSSCAELWAHYRRRTIF